MARVVVTSWRETYRGLMRDDVLDDPGMLAWRERFWTAALTEPRYAANRVAVAEAATPGGDREVVGVAMSGPPLDDAPPGAAAALRALRAGRAPRLGSRRRAARRRRPGGRPGLPVGRRPQPPGAGPLPQARVRPRRRDAGRRRRPGDPDGQGLSRRWRPPAGQTSTAPLLADCTSLVYFASTPRV